MLVISPVGGTQVYANDEPGTEKQEAAQAGAQEKSNNTTTTRSSAATAKGAASGITPATAVAIGVLGVAILATLVDDDDDIDVHFLPPPLCDIVPPDDDHVNLLPGDICKYKITAMCPSMELMSILKVKQKELNMMDTWIKSTYIVKHLSKEGMILFSVTI